MFGYFAYLATKMCNLIQHSMTIVNIPPLFPNLSLPLVLLVSNTIQNIAPFSHWMRRSRCKRCIILCNKRICMIGMFNLILHLLNITLNSHTCILQKNKLTYLPPHYYVHDNRYLPMPYVSVC